MTLTEAAACGTPAVATAITGHVDAVVHGTTGLLVKEGDDLVQDTVTSLDAILNDAALRHRLGAGAVARARDLTWEATAKGALMALAAEVSRVRRHVATPAVLGPAPAYLGPAPTAPASTPAHLSPAHAALGSPTSLTTQTAVDPRG